MFLGDMKGSEPQGKRQEQVSSGLNLGLLCQLLRTEGLAWLPEPLTLGQALARALPLPGDDKEDTADTQVSEEHIHPDVWGKGLRRRH